MDHQSLKGGKKRYTQRVINKYGPLGRGLANDTKTSKVREDRHISERVDNVKREIKRSGRRDSPALLPKKLLAIRKFLAYRQAEMASSLEAKLPSRAKPIKARSISAYENGHREPNLLVIVAYGHLAKVHLEFIADDRFTLKEFREQLGKHTLSHK